MAIETSLSAVILAGGRGTRIQAIHPDIPKPMVPVRGKPFLSWLTAFIADKGPRHFIYSTGYRSEQIETWCGNGEFPELVRVCRREDEPMGTGGGLLNCLDLCRDWLLCANGDGLCIEGLDQLLALAGTPGVDGGLIGVSVPDASRYGSLSISADGNLTAFREKVPGAGAINSGLYLFSRALLASVARPGASSLERDLIPQMLANGAVLKVVTVANAPFIDIGTPETLAEAEAFIDTYVTSAA